MTTCLDFALFLCVSLTEIVIDRSQRVGVLRPLAEQGERKKDAIMTIDHLNSTMSYFLTIATQQDFCL